MSARSATGWLIDGAAGPVELHYCGGIITRIAPLPEAPSSRRLLLPAFANAHDHARPLALSSFGAAFMPLETWLPRSMLATPPDPYLAAAAPLARAALSGCGSIMVHYTRPSGTMSLPQEAAEVARAARDVGVRIAFALAVRDQNPMVYGEHTDLLVGLPPSAQVEISRTFLNRPLTPQGYLDLVEAVADAAGSDMVDIQYGPAAPQWCSTALLQAIAIASANNGRRIHVHLLETRYQRAWADREFPAGIVRHLADIGLLTDRLTLAHCAYATPDELDMIAAAGTTIVTNCSSNLQIKSGQAPIADAVARGCRIAVGMDGLAFDEDDDMVREMRLAHALHGGYGFDVTWDRAQFLRSITAAGRRVIGAPGDGNLAMGAPADFVAIDVDALDRDQLIEVPPLDLLLARGNKSHVAEVVVAGRTIVESGRATGVNLPAIEQELRARYRQSLSSHAGLIESWPHLETGIRNWMVERCGCC